MALTLSLTQIRSPVERATCRLCRTHAAQLSLTLRLPESAAPSAPGPSTTSNILMPMGRTSPSTLADVAWPTERQPPRCRWPARLAAALRCCENQSSGLSAVATARSQPTQACCQPPDSLAPRLFYFSTLSPKISSSSIVKTSVSPPKILALGRPASPYARWEGMNSSHRSPSTMSCSASAQPLITSVGANIAGAPRSNDESNLLPSG
mmetsp:Transcript_173/g.593  ORF Transcript_173/g.593 Transcript_173/m.593 type:complete len:208 (-) Transcript_173:449-1072(-)